MIAKHLYTSDYLPLDLLIRTSGEIRISNFMLWQMAYSELYFTDTYWPDFNEDELCKALDNYAKKRS
ncbi:MAG: undecaprenyl diphosphate synthase family protein [Clostridium sp.]|nr:MAG: undecaprenyl diphosphate synthase family protein [Clostridium sp.]